NEGAAEGWGSPPVSSAETSRLFGFALTFLKALSSSLAELPIEEIRGRGVGLDPARVHQDVVDLVGEDELLEGHALLPERLGEVHALAEGDVPVVVAVDEEDGRAPRLHGGER